MVPLILLVVVTAIFVAGAIFASRRPHRPDSPEADYDDNMPTPPPSG
jgi:hypothetical protein